MKNKMLIKMICLGIIFGTSIEAIPSAHTISSLSKDKNKTIIENNIQILQKIKNLEAKYDIEITPTKEISADDIYLIESSIKDTIESLNKIKAQLNIPEKINFLSKAYQKFSGTAKIGASIPALGVYNVYIPYEYNVVQSGGNPPYFSSASTGVSYAAGIAIGSYSHQDSWATITSQSGRINNVLELRAKGTIVYSVSGVNITLPNQVFLKRFYL
ncbi:abortive infection system toxin AbiGii family protein [Clostridium sp.]|uniref:abortive infection system toxin AbiGii family protein n=1 Tax=Clostridium sp. TaxID=1506 RepID=UPI0025BE551E|nr:abortive infection system toxin AbiGii family protein [Clostridium sp.]MCI9302842.1 hypothetical protein [Clostridium sp.]